MVQLRRFVETDDAVHLILERAPGGKLWNYVIKHMSHREVWWELEAALTAVAFGLTN